MADADLEEIRKARLAQLKSQGGAVPPGSNDAQQQQQQQQQREREAEARASILGQILTPEAAERLGRIRLVKASRADDVENHLIRMATSGQLGGKITEEQLKGLLEAVSAKEEEEKGVKLEFKGDNKGRWDDDDLDDLLEGLK